MTEKSTEDTLGDLGSPGRTLTGRVGETGADLGKLTITELCWGWRGTLRFGKSLSWVMVGKGKIGHVNSGESSSGWVGAVSSSNS